MVKIVPVIFTTIKKKNPSLSILPTPAAAAAATITIRNTVNSFLGGQKGLAKSFDGASTFHSVFPKNPG